MEAPNAKGSSTLIVGLFVLVTLIVGAGFVVFMGGSGVFNSELRLNSLFKDARGLNVGAPVYMSGVDVGRVLRKALPPPGERGVLIGFSVEGRYRDRLRSSLKAEISSAGMLGDKTLVLLEGEGGDLLQEDARVGSHEDAGLQGYLEKGGEALENIRELTQNMSIIFKGGKTGKRIDEILENMVTASANLKKNTQGNWGQKLDQSLTHLDSVLAKVDKGEGTLGALVNDASLHEDLRVLLGGAKRSNLIRFLVNTAIKNKENKTALDETKMNAE